MEKNLEQWCTEFVAEVLEKDRTLPRTGDGSDRSFLTKKLMQKLAPVRELHDAIVGLSKIKNSKTLFELSPTEDGEVYKAWLRLDNAQKGVRELI